MSRFMKKKELQTENRKLKDQLEILIGNLYLSN